MTSVEHKVAMHQLATERRAAGRPVWERKIRLGHVFHNSDLTFEQRRDEIVRVVKHTSWYQQARRDDDRLVEVVECLATSDDADEWDGWWDEFYDIADADRVWIDTFA